MKKVIQLILGIVILITVILCFSGCKPYDKPEFVDISPSQTAIVIPLVDSANKQINNIDLTMKFLTENKVMSIQKQIAHRWIKTGWLPSSGEYIKTERLLVVERKPVTREWTEKKNTGTSARDEGIIAEDEASIGFMVRMNCSAKITAKDVIKFLYMYNEKTLADIMDTDIRAYVENTFVAECAKYSMSEILVNKGTIMKTVYESTKKYFEDFGITISILGLKGEVTYLNPDIQKAIDDNFKSAKGLVTQKNNNEITLSKAKADKQAMVILTQTSALQLKLKEFEIKKQALDNEAAAIAKWNGAMPYFSSSGGSGTGTIFNIPNPTINE